MTREEILKDRNYIVSGLQLQLLNLIEDYMKENNLNRDKLAKQLNVSKGYVSQLLNVTYDHKISKLVDLALSCNAMPLLYFINLDRYIKDDANDKYYELIPTMRPKAMTYELLEYDVQEDDDYTSFAPIKEITTGEVAPQLTFEGVA